MLNGRKLAGSKGRGYWHFVRHCLFNKVELRADWGNHRLKKQQQKVLTPPGVIPSPAPARDEGWEPLSHRHAPGVNAAVPTAEGKGDRGGKAQLCFWTPLGLSGAGRSIKCTNSAGTEETTGQWWLFPQGIAVWPLSFSLSLLGESQKKQPVNSLRVKQREESRPLGWDF